MRPGAQTVQPETEVTGTRNIVRRTLTGAEYWASRRFWTAEKVRQLTELWGKIPAHEIAARLEARSTNSVIGKARDLKLPPVNMRQKGRFISQALLKRQRAIDRQQAGKTTEGKDDVRDP